MPSPSQSYSASGRPFCPAAGPHGTGSSPVFNRMRRLSSSRSHRTPVSQIAIPVVCSPIESFQARSADTPEICGCPTRDGFPGSL